MSDKEFPIETWAYEEIELIRKFAKSWEEQRAVDPDNFPKEMTMGDWAEQFNIFCATEVVG